MIRPPTMVRLVAARARSASAPIAPVRPSRRFPVSTDIPHLPSRPARGGRVREPEAGAPGRPGAPSSHEAAGCRGLEPSRTFMRRSIPLFLSVAGLLLARPVLAVDDCATVAMTVTAQPSNDPGFEGLTKYTVNGSWDVGQFGLSHVDFFLALKNLECICDPRVVRFPAVAGTSTGVSAAGPCVVPYTGAYNCKGDPSIPAELRAPTVKFNKVEGTCETATTGTGTWTFYSPFPPAPYSVYPDGVAIKHGTQVCTGTLVGQMPMGDCATPARATSWGSMKATYR